MTPNDKLPETITDQINTEADKYGFVVPYDGSNKFYIEDKVKGYQAGATAWAGWKVRFDELKAENEKLNNRCHELMAENHVLSSKDDYAAQRMADALEIVLRNWDDAKLNAAKRDKKVYTDNADIALAKERLQQFKDGREVGEREPKPEGWPWVCEYCGKQDCGSDHK